VPDGGVPAAIGTGVVAGGVVLVVATAVMLGISRRPLLAAVSGLRGSSTAEVAGV
jgi:putative peptidoglycan lipid II flippase